MALDNGSITMDEPELDLDDAAERLLKQWTSKPDAAKPEQKPTQPAPEVEDEDSHEDPPEHDDGEHEEEALEEKPRVAADDEHEVVVSVDGQEHRVQVKDLKRLFGQEASLTRKSQEVATLRSQVTEQSEYHLTALKSMIGRAEERYKPYAEVDWALAAAKLPADEYQSLKVAAETLKADIDYYKEELGKEVDNARTQQVESLQQAAQQCNAALVTPESPHHIEGWNETVYNEIRTYAVEMGVPQETIDRTVDPAAIKLVHKAMLYDKAQKTAVKKLANAPRNVNKTPTNDSNASQGGERKAMERLRKSGDEDDAMAVLMARWSR